MTASMIEAPGISYGSSTTPVGSTLPAHVVMVRPHHFRVNPATAADNAYQRSAAAVPEEASARAYHESTGLADALRAAGVGVSLFEDESALCPDSVFPNNWFTTHPGGQVVLSAMYAQNRRKERRSDVIDHLRADFHVNDLIDLSPGELTGRILEGTGVVVIDHIAQIAYACRSHRLTEDLFDEYCHRLGLQPVLFDAVDADGKPVFHTNIMLSIGDNVVLIGSELIRDAGQRAALLNRLRATGRTVVELTEAQVSQFAGNALELSAEHGPVLAMSTTAHAALRPPQIAAIGSVTQILSVDIPTIEAAGGSVRCMLAGIHLPRRRSD